MSYTFASIVENEDVDETWVPRITDKRGAVAWGPSEGPRKSFRASGLTVDRGRLDSSNRLFSVADVSIEIHVSDERLVAVCRKFDKGGGWVGGAGVMIVFNAVSKARAAARSHGKFLVAQVRWPWLSEVGYAEKTGWASDNKLRLVVLDDAGRQLVADFKLPKDVNAAAIAGHILACGAQAREITPPPLPRYDAQTKRFALASLPGARNAAPAQAATAAVRRESEVRT